MFLAPQSERNTEVYRRGHNGPDSKSGGEILTDFIRTLEKARKTEKNGEKTRSYFRLFESSKSSSKNHLKKLSRIIRVNHIWRGIEEVITGLTRNQFAVNRRTWVRIPSSPPTETRLNLLGSNEFSYFSGLSKITNFVVFGRVHGHRTIRIGVTENQNFVIAKDHAIDKRIEEFFSRLVALIFFLAKWLRNTFTFAISRG